jgi:signal transduction histidine kinase/HPt (histidine-containing phosphotransfer) domain-containing protein/ActR/RegA family two-component response regulator
MFQTFKGVKPLLFSFLFVSLLFANPFGNGLVAQIYNFERYSLPEGLSQSQVFDIKQDTLGRVWLATERGGITILSGDFPQYIGRNEGLPGTTTASLFYDKKHRMWIGTNRGVRYYDGKSLCKPLNGTVLDTMFVWDITQRTDGTIIMATDHGVFGFNDSVGCFNLIPELTNIPVSTVAARTNNLIYLTAYNTPLFIYDGQNLEEVKLPLSDGANVEVCFFDSRDQIWIGTTRGLITRDEYYYKTYTTADGLNDDHVISIEEDRFGNIWVGTDEGGISIISDKEITNITARQGIGYNRVYSLYCDNYKNMWVGTDGAGAYVFKGFRFTKMEIPEFIETTSVTAIHSTPKNKLFIGTNGYGLLCVDGNKRTLFSRRNGLSNNVVRSIASDKNGVIYVGTDRGIDIIRNMELDLAKRDKIDIKEPVSCVYADPNGDIWVGTIGHGLFFINEKRTLHYMRNNGLAGNHVFDIVQNQTGETYVATDEGLSIIKQNGIQNYTVQDGLPSDIISSLILDKNNKLWVVTEKGLTRIGPSEMYHIALEELSNANIIYSAVNDIFGNIVLGTERGIDILSIDSKSNRISNKNYRREDGFFGIECNLNSVEVGKNGDILFGTKQGITVYNPLADSIKNPMPRAYIRDVELYYSKIDWKIYTDSIINWSLLPHGLTLPHFENNLTFYFGANDYQAPQKLMLQFYLKGFDPDWMAPTRQRFINYTNLPPGKYTMKVRTWYSPSEYSSNFATFEFQILKPIYTRAWFIVLALLTISTLVLIFWNWRVRAIRANERRLEGVVRQRTSDLLKQREELILANIQISQGARMKEQFLANTSHEIRTPLNVISGYTNLLMNTRVDSLQQKYLNYIKESSDNLKVIVNDILDFSKIEADKLEFDSVPFDFVKSIRTTGNHMEIEAAKQGLSLELNFSNIRHAVVLGDPVRLNQILSNLVRNAIKFTPSGGITVNIEDISSDPDLVILVLEVQDTGIGIPEDKLDQIFDSFSQASNETTRKFGGTGLGLSIVKRLVEKQNGEIKVESEVDKGSNFRVIIPFQKSDADPVEENKADYSICPHNLSRDVKILLVDDNEINLALAENTLTSYSPQFRIQTAMNGLQAVELASRELYDIIVMDIQMPEMDGYTATNIIRTTLGEPLCCIPILGMTAHAMSDEREKCLQHGMDEYITKPFVPRVFFEFVLKLTNTTATKSGDFVESGEQSMPVFAGLDPQQLWKNSAGKIERFVRYLDMYMQAIPTQIKDLEEGIKSQKFDEIRILSHTLKTSFRYLGIKKAQASALEIEKASMENNVIDYLELMTDIHKYWENAYPEITNFLNKVEMN